MHTLVCLGRYGDILNALPIAKLMAPVRFMVAREFSGILDGVDYVTPLIWQGDYSDLPGAMNWLQANGMEYTVAQSYNNPDARKLTDSYQRESWRLAGVEDEFGAHPLLFTNRSPEREAEIAKQIPKRPYILVASGGVSSPIAKLDGLVDEMRATFPDYLVLDLNRIKAERIYDLIPLLDGCKLLVSVDTVWLHLARAARCPVLAIINDGWLGSVPPPATVGLLRYSEATTVKISEMAGQILDQPERKVFLHRDSYGLGYTAKRMNMLFNMGFSGERVHAAKRGKPKLWDILKPDDDMDARDIVIWTNTDVKLAPGIVEWAKKHAGIYGAVSMRRNEDGHVGRELFAFTKEWLVSKGKDGLTRNRIPDCFIAAPYFDLHLAAIIRKERGIKSTLSNMALDFYPADARERHALHDPHPSSWNEFSMEAQHNKALFTQWLKDNNMEDFWSK